MIVSGLNQKYTTISTSQFVTYVYDGDDNYAIKQAEIQTDNENQVTVNMIVHDTSNNSDKYYTITTSKESVYEEKWGYTQSVSEAIKEQTDTFGTEGYFNTTVYQENVFLSWLPTIISTIVILGIAIFFFRFLMSSAGGNKQAMDFNKSTARRVDNSKVRFKDVAGCDEEKAEMVELVDYLKEPKKYTKCGAK